MKVVTMWAASLVGGREDGRNHVGPARSSGSSLLLVILLLLGRLLEMGLLRQGRRKVVLADVLMRLLMEGRLLNLYTYHNHKLV